MKKSLILLALSLSACSIAPSHEASTVSITELTSRSGGSGTIVFSSENLSLVLTNAHVCGVTVNGGLVHTNDGKIESVVSYRVSQFHDLCLIAVAANLGPAAHLSAQSPKRYSSSLVVGHPKLLPTMSTPGKFSDNIMVQVMTGSRECSEAEKSDDNTAILCAFFGRLPIIKNYEAATTSSLIQPGSSGSAVYGEDGGISAVIFAGSGDLGYGLAVPYESVANFINYEVVELPMQVPNPFVQLSSPAGHRSEREYIEKLEKFCTHPPTDKVKAICKRLSDATDIDDLIQRDDE